jgi:hypothetical protein
MPPFKATQIRAIGSRKCVPAFGVLLACLLGNPSIARADCVDYSTYLHWLGNVSDIRTPLDIDVSGTTLSVSAGYEGLYIVDASNPSAPVVSAHIDSLGYFFDTAWEGSRLYAASFTPTTSILDVSIPSQPHLLGDIPHRGKMASLGDRLLISSDTLWIADVSQPGSTRDLGSLQLPGATRAIAANATSACVGSTGGMSEDYIDSLLIVGIVPPSDPVLLGALPLPGMVQAIALSDGYAYLVMTSNLVVVDVSDPASPLIAALLPLSGYLQDLSLHGALCIVATSTGLISVDVSVPQEPKIVDTIPFPPDEGGLTHIAGDGELRFVSTYAAGGNCPTCTSTSSLRVVDIANGSRPPRVGRIQTDGFAWGTRSQGRYLYAAADVAGLQIVDTADTTFDVLSTLDTPGEAFDIALEGGTAVIADGTDIVVADVSDPHAPAIRSVLPDRIAARAVSVANGVAYVTDGPAGLLIIDVSDPAFPAIVSTLDTPYFATDVASAGSYAYVTDRVYGLFVIDTSNPSLPQVVGTLDTPGYAMGLALSGNLAFIADETTVLVVDVSVPSSPVLIGSTSTPGLARSVAVLGGRAYVADAFQGLAVIDASDPQLPVVVGGDQSYGSCFGVSASDRVYLSDGFNGIHALPLDCDDLTDVEISEFTAASNSEGILLTWKAPETKWVTFRVERSLAFPERFQRIGEPLTAQSVNRFLDDTVEPGRSYSYRLEAQDRSGDIARFGPISIRFDPPRVHTSLHQNVPNPFGAGSTSIAFSLGQSGTVSLRIFDLSGRLVRTLAEGPLGYGEHAVAWDGRDRHGNIVSAGVYLYRLDTPELTRTRRLIKLP